MTVGVFRFSFSTDVPLDEVEVTLQLATFAVEGLFGTARVRIDFSYDVIAVPRLILIDGTKEVGATVVQVFAALLLREFGDDSFHVARVDSQHRQPQEVLA